MIEALLKDLDEAHKRIVAALKRHDLGSAHEHYQTYAYIQNEIVTIVDNEENMRYLDG